MPRKGEQVGPEEGSCAGEQRFRNLLYVKCSEGAEYLRHNVNALWMFDHAFPSGGGSFIYFFGGSAGWESNLGRGTET